MSTPSPMVQPPEGYLPFVEQGFKDPFDPDRPNRMCVCFSDVHFTDNTVGNQSADSVVWENVFIRIMDLCVYKEIEELTLVLVGDVADMIRTSKWTELGVYPWNRTDPRFSDVVKEILDGIIREHAEDPIKSNRPERKQGFFWLLKQLPARLAGYESLAHPVGSRRSRVQRIQTIVLLGNHDKELLADPAVLQSFYEACLGRQLASLTPLYRQWVGAMYFGDAGKFAAPDSVPWLPFYWGDPGFRLFVTHGQWRDDENSRSISSEDAKPGWSVSDGWKPGVWQQLRYAPFTAPCFGDTVAAGLLSGFIYRANKLLEEYGKPKNSQDQDILDPEDAKMLGKVLSELDLYRPTYAAVRRVIELTRKLDRKVREKPGSYQRLGEFRILIEKELNDAIYSWVNLPFIMESASPGRRWLILLARFLLGFSRAWEKVVHRNLGIKLRFLAGLMHTLEWFQRWRKQSPSSDEMAKFPGFLDGYREYGFRIHGEGHTHVPVEEEMYFKTPEKSPNYTYINFGAWRDNLVMKGPADTWVEKSLLRPSKGYRRRGAGRALVVLDLLPTASPSADPTGKKSTHDRRVAYWVEDLMIWGDGLDEL